MKDSFMRLKDYLEDNIQYEKTRLSLAVEVDDKIHRAANYSTFLRILNFVQLELELENNSSSTMA